MNDQHTLPVTVTVDRPTTASRRAADEAATKPSNVKGVLAGLLAGVLGMWVYGVGSWYAFVQFGGKGHEVGWLATFCCVAVAVSALGWQRTALVAVGASILVGSVLAGLLTWETLYLLDTPVRS